MNTITSLKMLASAFICLTIIACTSPQKPEMPESFTLGDPIFLWEKGIGVELALPMGFEASELQSIIANQEQQIAIWYNVLDRYFTDYETDYEAKSFKAMNLEMFQRERTLVDGKNALLTVSENPTDPKEFTGSGWASKSAAKQLKSMPSFPPIPMRGCWRH